MTKSLDQLRRDASALKKAYDAGDRDAHARVAAVGPRLDGTPLKHADFLHVIAREGGFASWPHLKLSAETHGLDRAERQQRLGLAAKSGQAWAVDRMLADDPHLPRGNIGLACCLYLKDEALHLIDADPGLATARVPQATPLTVLAQSRMIHHWPERAGDMLAIAEALLARGADVDASVPLEGGGDHRLSTLYFAIGHADNMPLARWLLDHGADPNDNESLYHATELGHHEGLRLLLTHGAEPRGTNALLRAMDFHDLEAVRLLLAAGARPDDFNEAEVGGEAPWTVPALHQAARRRSDPQMVDLLLEAGADPARAYEGASAYAYARVFGNAHLARAIEARGPTPPLSREETLLARAADGLDSPGEYLDPARLPDAYRNIIRTILHLQIPGIRDWVRRLVALGVEYDRPDGQGLTPVQIAGWEGLPEMMADLMALKPDLGHVNGYGGTLQSTIVHGSENCPERARRDHVACLRLALEAGAALPRRMADRAVDPEVAAFLSDWAEAHPGAVVEHGPT